MARVIRRDKWERIPFQHLKKLANVANQESYKVDHDSLEAATLLMTARLCEGSAIQVMASDGQFYYHQEDQEVFLGHI